MTVNRRLLEDGGLRLLEDVDVRLLEDSTEPNRIDASGAEFNGRAVRRQRAQMRIDRTVSGRPGGVQWPRGG